MTHDLGILCRLVALDFYGEGHHLVIDASFSSVWKNATIRGCSTVPGFAAAQREQAKFDADDRASSKPVSRMHGGAHTLVPFVLEDGGRPGRQGQAWLLQLAGWAVDSGRVRPPAAWHTPSGGALVALTAHRWQQRLSAWLHTKLSTLLLRR